MDDMDLVIEIAAEHAKEVEGAWKEVAELLYPDDPPELPPADTIERFDGLPVVEWIVKLAPRAANVFTKLFAVLAKRQVTVHIGSYKFENVSPDDIVKILKAIKSSGITLK